MFRIWFVWDFCPSWIIWSSAFPWYLSRNIFSMFWGDLPSNLRIWLMYIRNGKKEIDFQTIILGLTFPIIWVIFVVADFFSFLIVIFYIDFFFSRNYKIKLISNTKPFFSSCLWSWYTSARCKWFFTIFNIHSG